MTPNGESIGQTYLAQARHRLAACHERIQHCLGQLDDLQVWWRPRVEMNSAANLILHLCGNLRQWIVSALTDTPDVRDRPAEFTEQGPIPRGELLRRLNEVVAEADAALAAIPEVKLLEPHRIQGFDETILSAIFSSISHLAGHTQEIVHLTRLQLGEAYRFAWVPATAEQGAPLDPPTREAAAATDAVFEQPIVPTADLLPNIEPPPRKSPLRDYVRELGEEFQDQEDEGKL